MDTDFSVLFDRPRLGNVILKNRIVMSPTGTMADLSDGSLSPSQLDYYEERARGGVGMVIIGGQVITNRLEPWTYYMTVADTDRQTRGWRQLAERIKAFGAKACLQFGGGLGRCGFPAPGSSDPMPSASEVPSFYFPDRNTRSLTLDEIQYLVGCHARAAMRAKIAGFDVIEIHAHVGYLLDQFMSSVWNKRTDQYGGSFENRMRLIGEIITAVRAAVGKDFPLLFRFSLEHKFVGGRTIADGLNIVRYLEAAGIDGLDIDAGSYEAHPWLCPPAYYGDACMADVAAEVKKITRLPVLNTGNYTPETAAAAVKAGKTDFVMLGRGLIADPEWPAKLQQGRRADIRPCIRCNEHCIGNIAQGCIASCSVNPRTGEEKVYEVKAVRSPKRIVVIGGGPAGMEAARVAAEKGHTVALYEKGDRLGGQLLAATAPFKSQLRAYVQYLITQMDKLGVAVHLKQALDATSDVLHKADHIIVAVGSRAVLPAWPGAHRLLTLEDALLGQRTRLGQHLLIIGADKHGCDTAIEFALEGRQVTLVESSDEIAASANFDDKMVIAEKFAELGIPVMTQVQVTRIEQGGAVVITASGDETRLAADTVIYSGARRPNTDLATALLMAFPQAIAVGDCEAPGFVGNAVRRGFFTAWALD